MTDEKKSERHPSFGQDIVRETIVAHVFPWIWKVFTGRHEDNQKKKGDKTTFAEAMTKLKVADPTAHDIIMDFVGGYLKDRPADQEDFEVNAARTGPTVAETLEFLKHVASLPDHDAREVYLSAFGYIGARSVDVKERALKLASDLKRSVENLPSKIETKVTKLTDKVDKTAKTINKSKTAKRVEAHATGFQNKWERELKKLQRTRRTK